IRGFSIRGIVAEDEIVRRAVGPVEVIFAGLFGRRPERQAPAAPADTAPVDEAAVLASLIDRAFHRSCERTVGAVADFVARYPGLGPEVVIQYLSPLRKAGRKQRGLADRGLNDERRPGALLVEMITTHMENVAVGGLSMYANRLLVQ